MNENELYHYGVLGMKWGVRRSRKLHEKSLKAKSNGDKEKSIKYENKSKAIIKKHESRTSKETVKRVSNQSMTKTLVQTAIIGGTYGALKYNEARVNKNTSVGKAFVKATVYNEANLMTGGLLSIIEPRRKQRKQRTI